MIRISLGTIASILLLALVVRADAPATNAPTSEELKAKAEAVAHAMATDGCTVETFTVHSSAMDRDIKGLVILPPEYKDHPDKKYPVLYALHGSDAPFESFSKMVTLRAALKTEPMVVASFDGDADSMYIDSPQPQQWSRDHKDTSLKKSLFTTFFFDDFIPYVDKTYRVDPKQRMLTGFSMGGFGAFHFMLTKPEMFVSVSSMSGYFPVLTPPPADDDEGWGTLIGPYEQNQSQFAAVDFYKRIEADVAQGVKLPPICLRCGTEDHLLGSNQRMRDFLKTEGIPCDYVESPGAHTWTFWKNSATGIIDFHWKSLQQK
jgi:putative tributyrin esterase